MRQTSSSRFLFCWLLLASFALPGCSGDSSSGSPEDDGPSPFDPGPGGVNRDLPGRMLLTSEYVLDLDTGRTRPFVRSTSIPSHRLQSLVPNPDATRFHAVHESCGRDSFYFVNTDCIVTFDADGNEISRFGVGKPVFNSAWESFDGTMIAFVVYNPEFDSRSLTITDLSGNVLSEGLYEGGEFIRSDVAGVRWLPDGDLVYEDISRDRLFRVVNPPVARPEDDRLIFDPDGKSMPGGEEANGLLGWFDVNPSSGQIAFVWNAGPNSVSRDDTLYLIGSDGSGLRPLARATAVRSLQAPQWSFDGDWIAVVAGGRAIAAQTRQVALVGLRVDVSEELLIDDRARTESDDIVFVDSDCRLSVGCGYEDVEPVTSEVASGWFP